MSVDIVSPIAIHSYCQFDVQLSEQPGMESPPLPSQPAPTRRRSGLTTALIQPPTSFHPGTHTLTQGDDDDEDSLYESRKPSDISSTEDLTSQEVTQSEEISCRPIIELQVAGWHDRERGQYPQDSSSEPQDAVFHAVSALPDPFDVEDNKRKTSDPLVNHRGEVLRRSRFIRHRCLSDSEKENNEQDLLVCDETGDCSSSVQGCDSGFDDCRPKYPKIESRETKPTMRRKIAPHHSVHTFDHSMLQNLREEAKTSSSSEAPSKSRLTKHLSLCSLGESSETISYSSLTECSSSIVTYADFFNSLGFCDFENPGLIPDRFIPRDVMSARPSVMKVQALMALSSNTPSPTPPESVANDQESLCQAPSVSDFTNSPKPSPTSPVSLHDTLDLPLGATADNFVTRSPRSASPPPPPSHIHSQAEEELAYSPATDPSISQYHRRNAPLETVPEETASDMSPSPRWLSPRVSLDHTAMDLTIGQLLTVASVRKRSLPSREGYRVSVESLASEQDSIYFSVTSYDDDIAREKEKEKEELMPPVPVDDVPVRRRRRGVYEPPAQLLSWLEHQKSEEEEENSPEEQPWPFNEQAHLRKSLSELVEAQHRRYSPWDRPLSPVLAFPTDDVAPRRSSLGTTLRRKDCFPSANLHRQSLPGICRFSSSGVYQQQSSTELQDVVHGSPSSTRLPPGMTRAEALGYRRQSLQLQTELDSVQEKLNTSEYLRHKEEREHRHRLSDVEGYWRNQLHQREHQFSCLEEEAEGYKQELKRLKCDVQVAVARGKEFVRDQKNAELTDMRQKMEQAVDDMRKKMHKLEEECRHLRSKEKSLLMKANQQTVTLENEQLLKEVSQLKQQLDLAKQAQAATIKENALEMKKQRTKVQVEKEEALRAQKLLLQKVHDKEIDALKQTLSTLKPVSPSVRLTSADSYDRKQLLQQHKAMLEEKDKLIDELQDQLKHMHMERLLMEKKSVQ